MKSTASPPREMIPYLDLVAQHRPLKEKLLAAVERVFDHGNFILGPEVRELEARLAELLSHEGKTPQIITVNSGTDALILALRLLGVGPGDEVLTASHSFVSTASSIALVGATPVFVDLDDETMVLDPDRLEASLTPRTRAVIPVHLNGYPAQVDQLSEFCQAHNLHLIEDAAQALGARFSGRPVGTAGIGCYSMHPLKVLSACGDAGFLSVWDDDQAVLLRQLRNNGLLDRDHCVVVGNNSRLDTLQAALLLVKLEELDGWIAARRERARRYREALGGRLRMPPEDGDHFQVYSAFVVRHPRRDALAEALKRRGVDAKVHYPLAIHQQPAYSSQPLSQPLPVTEKVVDEILSLPVIPELDLGDQERIIVAVHEALDEVESEGLR